MNTLSATFIEEKGSLLSSIVKDAFSMNNFGVRTKHFDVKDLNNNENYIGYYPDYLLIDGTISDEVLTDPNFVNKIKKSTNDNTIIGLILQYNPYDDYTIYKKAGLNFIILNPKNIVKTIEEVKNDFNLFLDKKVKFKVYS
jgi:hypothetical protein